MELQYQLSVTEGHKHTKRNARVAAIGLLDPLYMTADIRNSCRTL